MPTDWKSLGSNRKRPGMAWLIAFFVLQIAIDLCHSVTAFPFVHYGMFSESFAQPDSLPVFEVTVDDRLLDAHDFRIYRWDMIQNPLAAFDRQTRTRDFAFDKEKLQTGLHFIGAGSLYSLVAPNLGNEPTAGERFPAWYKAYLSRLLGHPIRHLAVAKTWYRYVGGHFIVLKKDAWINL
jgi:hypothetical protein